MVYVDPVVGISVHLHNDEEELPTKGEFYIVAGNGLFLHKEDDIVSGLIPVKTISLLKDLEAKSWVKCHLPKIPASEVYKIKTFFARVVDAHRAEANTILFFNKNTQEYRVVVSEQIVTHGGVSYARPATTHVDDFVPVGTIHSHCDFAAFHSGTDVNDEKHWDGLHITFGDNHRSEITITSSIAVNGYRQEIDPLTVLDGIEHVSGKTYRLKDTPVLAEWDEEINQWFSKVKAL